MPLFTLPTSARSAPVPEVSSSGTVPPPSAVETLLGVGPRMKVWNQRKREERKAYERQVRQTKDEQRRKDEEIRKQLAKIKEREYAQRGIRDLSRNFGRHSKDELQDPRVRHAKESYEKIERKMVKDNRLSRRDALHELKKGYTERVRSISRDLRNPERLRKPAPQTLSRHLFGNSGRSSGRHTTAA